MRRTPRDDSKPDDLMHHAPAPRHRPAGRIVKTWMRANGTRLTLAACLAFTGLSLTGCLAAAAAGAGAGVGYAVGHENGHDHDEDD